MKVGTFRKVCLTVMGVGVVSSLVSVGTFATFTATVTNPSNTFSAGTLQITTLTTAGTSFAILGSTGAGLQGPNITTAGSVTSVADCTKVSASACSTLIATSKVSTQGMEPGQYAKGTITITNAGTLPAAFLVQAQNASVTNVVGACPTDIGSAPANTIGAPTACTKLGDALNITLEDTSGSATSPQCVYGKNTTPAPGANSAQAPSGIGNIVATAGVCDTVINPTLTNGTGLSTGNSFHLPADAFTAFKTALAPGVYIPGANPGATTLSVGGNSVARWAPGEAKTFNVTIAFPDQGVTTHALGSDTVTIGYDNAYQGGSVSFDLLWYAQQ